MSTMPFQLAQAAAALEPRLVLGDARITGVSTDSRTLAPGELFVALRGDRFDGHDHAAQARERGAAALLVERELPVALPQLVVLDTLAALGELARWYRAAMHAQVLGITGSNGKTTVKTLTAAILARVGRTHVNQGNFNNEIGLPLSLLRLPEDARYAVLEMGAGKPGDIEYLARIAQPQVGLVNNVGSAHLERLGSEAGVAQTKGAIYEALPVDGVAVINADDAWAASFAERSRARRRLRFGLREAADVSAHGLELAAEHARFTLLTPRGEAPVRLPLAGRHNVANALAAAALALAVDASLEAVVDGLEHASGIAGRLTRRRIAGRTVIDDSYNANPGSTRAAIDVLALERGPRWLALGNMAELGPDAATLHRAIGSYARERGIDRLYAVGALAAEAAAGFGAGAEVHESQERAAEAIAAAWTEDTVVLVKGSRSSAMERLVRALEGSGGGESHAA